jgi:hypothetical protein
MEPFMTNFEILFKALNQACKNGFTFDSDYILYDYVEMITCMGIEFKVIYSHAFAKAFFTNNWPYHLQQMVIDEEPIKYLERFLNDTTN